MKHHLRQRSSALQPVKVSPEVMSGIHKAMSHLNWGGANKSSHSSQSPTRQVFGSLLKKAQSQQLSDEDKKKLEEQGVSMDDLQKLGDLNK